MVFLASHRPEFPVARLQKTVSASYLSFFVRNGFRRRKRHRYSTVVRLEFKHGIFAEGISPLRFYQYLQNSCILLVGQVVPIKKEVSNKDN